MYEAFYGLRAKPFSILPDPDIIYWGRNHRLAFAMLEYGIMNNAGFTVITGEIGCGKTTLLRYLLRNLDGQMTIGLITWRLLAPQQRLNIGRSISATRTLTLFDYETKPTFRSLLSMSTESCP